MEQMLQSLNGSCHVQKWPGRSIGVEMATAGWESVCEDMQVASKMQCKCNGEGCKGDERLI